MLVCTTHQMVCAADTTHYSVFTIRMLVCTVPWRVHATPTMALHIRIQHREESVATGAQTELSGSTGVPHSYETAVSYQCAQYPGGCVACCQHSPACCAHPPGYCAHWLTRGGTVGVSRNKIRLNTTMVCAAGTTASTTRCLVCTTRGAVPWPLYCGVSRKRSASAFTCRCSLSKEEIKVLSLFTS